MKRVTYWALGIAVVGAALILITGGSDKPASPASGKEYLSPASTLRDVHGLAVDVADPSKVWIASHNGLSMLKDDKELFAVGDKRDDYMGFSTHPSDPNIFYSSGHPASGGNIGFQKTTDGGRTWSKLSDGVGGPVDFHTIAVAQADPNIIYGVFRGQLQKSTDGGNSWQLVENAPQSILLATNSKDKDTVYAATQDGLRISTDQGKTWANTGLDSAVFALAINPVDPKQMLASTKDQGLVRSVDAGITWQATASNAPQGIMYIAFSKGDPRIFYVLTQDLSLHKTVDNGQSWQKVR